MIFEICLSLSIISIILTVVGACVGIKLEQSDEFNQRLYNAIGIVVMTSMLTFILSGVAVVVHLLWR